MNKEKPLPTLRTIHERLKFARERAGVTQKVPAEICGITVQAVSQWEKGVGKKKQTKPDAERFPALAALYEVPVEWLLSDEPIPEAELELLALVAEVRTWHRQEKDAMIGILTNQIKLGLSRKPPGSSFGEFDKPPL